VLASTGLARLIVLRTAGRRLGAAGLLSRRRFTPFNVRAGLAASALLTSLRLGLRGHESRLLYAARGWQQPMSGDVHDSRLAHGNSPLWVMYEFGYMVMYLLFVQWRPKATSDPSQRRENCIPENNRGIRRGYEAARLRRGAAVASRWCPSCIASPAGPRCGRARFTAPTLGLDLGLEKPISTNANTPFEVAITM
jgi:hypothetical protein